MSKTTPPAAHAGRQRSDNIPLGIGIALVVVVLFGVQDALSKMLVQTHSTFQLAMIRFWAFSIFSLMLVRRQGPLKEAFRSRFPVLQILRAALLVADIWLFTAAIGSVPFAELQAIVLIYPLLVTLVAIPILGEKVGIFRLVAVSIGFAGALVIVRPGGLPLTFGVLLGVLAAVSYALYVALTRKVSSADSTATSIVYVGVGGLVMTSAVGVFFWEPMDLQAILMIAAITVSSIAAHSLMMVALSLAPASTLQPFNYLSLPWGIFLSYAVFGHMIDGVSLIGAIIIVGAGLVVMARERYLFKRGRSDPALAPEAQPPH